MGGKIWNRSEQGAWITGDGKRYWLYPGQSSREIGVQNANGLLLDGRRVLFQSSRIDLGGGKVWTAGAIKVCDLGTLSILNGNGTTSDLVASINALGLLCPFASGGYKTVAWCHRYPDWTFETMEIGRDRSA